jgi:hypothetical protein
LHTSLQEDGCNCHSSIQTCRQKVSKQINV